MPKLGKIVLQLFLLYISHGLRDDTLTNKIDMALLCQAIGSHIRSVYGAQTWEYKTSCVLTMGLSLSVGGSTMPISNELQMRTDTLK